MSARRGIPGWLAAIIGVVVLLLVWWAASFAHYDAAGGVSYRPIPSPLEVADWLFVKGYVWQSWPIFAPTIAEAGLGFLWGNLVALVLCALVLVLPWLETVVTQIAVITYCLPIVAVGAIAIVLLGGAKHAGDPSTTAVFLSALCIFFTTVVGTLLGFKSADRAALDVVRVYGGGRWTQLVRVRLVAALPAILNALQIAVPTSFLGAVLGEYLGSIDRSVGTSLIVYQSHNDATSIWAIFLLCAFVALVGYAVVGLVARLVTPWVRGRARA